MAEDESLRASTPPLCVADDGTFWPWLSWTSFEDWPNRDRTVVVAPIAGLADWGLGHPLDAEETVLMAVLQRASMLVHTARKPLVLPPLRFTFGVDPSCAFAVDQATAHGFISEVAASVAAAGFRRIVLLNSSPWSEEVCNAAARDLHVSRGLHMFQVNLSAIGLDFHPQRGANRRGLQTLLTLLYGRAPEDEVPAGPPPSWGTEPVGGLPGAALGLDEARAQGVGPIDDAAARLAKLLSDIHDEKPLEGGLT